MGRHRICVDTETTGLDPRIHVPVEVAWLDMVTGDRGRFVPPHTPADIDAATPIALEVNRYRERGLDREPQDHDGSELRRLHSALVGNTWVGSKPQFDIDMLTPLFERYGLDPQPHYHHPLDVGSYVAGAWLLDDALSLSKACTLLEVPQPDHTAEGDVEATAACFRALTEKA
jgi:DNA polymerase-3 subunit epsilon